MKANVLSNGHDGLRDCAPALAISLALHAGVLSAVPPFASLRSSLADAVPMTVRFVGSLSIAEPASALAAAVPAPGARPAARSSATQSPPRQANKPPQRPPPPAMTKQAPAPSLSVAAAQTPETAQPSEPLDKPASEAPAPRAAAQPAPTVPPEFKAAYLDNPRPDYPALSKRYREQGQVMLRVHVSAAGAVTEIELHSSSGWPRLDRAAEEAVRAWRFVPAKRGGAAVPGWVIVPLNFSLQG